MALQSTLNSTMIASALYIILTRIIGNHTAGYYYFLPEARQPSVCFLSKKEREVLPNKGPSRFEIENLPQRVPKISPNKYNVPTYFSSLRKNKDPIVQGFDGYNLRFKWKPVLSPAPCKYNTCSFPKKVKPNKYAFNSTANRKPLYPDTTDRPGIGAYHAETIERNRHVAFKYCFNSKKTMIPIVEFKCCPFKYDQCNMCEEVPDLDYWELVDADAEEPEYLCRPCMAKKKPSEIEGKVYKKVRNCSFMHIHQKTNNTIYLIEHKYWMKHQRLEAYFSRYYED